MKRWDVAFRIAIVALLAVIALELGGAKRIADAWHDASRAVRSVGKLEEAPAASPGGAPIFAGPVSCRVPRACVPSRNTLAS